MDDQKGRLRRYMRAYFLNHKEQVGYFTTDDRVPIDTIPFERLVRTIACYRKWCWFKHNPDYTQDMRYIPSSYATLEVNGMKNPIEWLQNYSSALLNIYMRTFSTLKKATVESLETLRRGCADCLGSLGGGNIARIARIFNP